MMAEIVLLRAYLFAGLVAHKVIWERLKRRPRPPSIEGTTRTPDVRIRLVKLVKLVVLALILVQTAMPFSWAPIAESSRGLMAVGVLVYTVGLALAISGRTQLGGNWSDIEAAQVLPQQAVVHRGVYKYVRHPIYVGDLLLLTGLELSLNSWLVLGIGILAPVVLLRAIREEELLKSVLVGYREYCATSKRFIPFVV
jgi:protein-S-isoprenylcysteine O-methyltransferase Ste14